MLNIQFFSRDHSHCVCICKSVSVVIYFTHIKKSQQEWQKSPQKKGGMKKNDSSLLVFCNSESQKHRERRWVLKVLGCSFFFSPLRWLCISLRLNVGVERNAESRAVITVFLCWKLKRQKQKKKKKRRNPWHFHQAEAKKRGAARRRAIRGMSQF